MTTFRTLLSYVFISVNALLIAGMLASAYSGMVSPMESMLSAYLGLGFLIFLVLNLCFLLYWLCVRAWTMALIGAAAFLLCWSPIRTNIPFNPSQPPAPKERTIKLLTYNVMSFAGKQHTKVAPNRIIDYIVHSEADIVCLQEYATQSKGLTDEVIRKALYMYPYHSVMDLNANLPGTHGLALYSKYPITRTHRINYPSLYNGSALYELNIHGKKLALLNNHLESFKLTAQDRTRYSGIVHSFTPEKLGGITTTFRQKLGPAFRIRSQQARTLAHEIKHSDADYLIVCGDFNDTPLSYTYHTVSHGLTDAFVASGNGVGITYNQNIFRFRIDHILHTPNLTPYRCTIDHVPYSDHYPLWCYLQLPP